MDDKTREAIRYLGYRNHTVDRQTLDLIESEFQELNQIVSARHIYRIFSMEVDSENKKIQIESMHICSESLYRNLNGCKEVVLFAATLGIEVDRRIQKLLIMDLSRAVVSQACAAALLEEYCDSIQNQIGEELSLEEKYLRPRFSPGYGDFPIDFQSQFVRILESAKRIGLTLTDSLMMTPTKSVTALIGISTIKQPCHSKGCESCGKTDCEYRRD